MSETAVFKVCVRGRDLSRDDVLRRFREAAASAGVVGWEEQDLVVRTLPPLSLQKSWPDWLPDPLWIVQWKRERPDAPAG